MRKSFHDLIPDPAPERQVRVIFRSPPDFREDANIWVGVVSGEGVRLRLLHDYPDFHPQVGWHVEIGEEMHAIREVIPHAGGSVIVCD